MTRKFKIFVVVIFLFFLVSCEAVNESTVVGNPSNPSNPSTPSSTQETNQFGIATYGSATFE